MGLNTNICKGGIFYLIGKYSNIVSRAETEMLLSYLLNCSRMDLYVRDFVENEALEKQYDSLIRRRLSGEPIQYITGSAEFMGLDFIVGKGIFIPRPETEILVNEAVIAGNRLDIKDNNLLDLCTGCGNIAISLARLMPCIEITAIDVSEHALKTAEKNAALHNVNNRIRFYKGDVTKRKLGCECIDKNPKFDIIVCNPPYIKEPELKGLQREVLFEPEISLNGGKDGLDFYRLIAEDAPAYLKKDGTLLMEIGFGQTKEVIDIFSSYNIFEIYRIVKDFAGIDRVIWYKGI
jgi:release factor glutamine methyltransferase